MARYRTIKPSFWTSAQVSRLPKPTALFFISLWTFAEDDGVISSDPRTLALHAPIFRPQDVEKMLNALWKEGLIKRSPSDGLVLITGWAHQKIDKPRAGKYKTNEIQWLEYSDSTNGRDQSKNTRRKESSVEESKVKESSSISEGVAIATPPRTVEAKVEVKTLGSRIWEAYEKAYVKRWGETPVRNKTTNSQCANLGQRLGENAIPVVEFYLTHNDGYYIKQHHPIGALLSNAEAMHTQWKRGQAVTSQQVRQFEKQSGNMDLLEKVRRGEA